MFAGAERKFVGANPPRGAVFHYSLSKKAEKVELKVVDYAGQLVRKLDAKNEPGLYRATWDLARLPNVRQAQPGASRGGPGGGAAGGAGPQGEGLPGGGGGGGGFGGFNFGQLSQPGMYRVVLTVDGQEFTQPLRIEADPSSPGALIAEDNDKDEDEDADRKPSQKPMRIDD
jgi:hypothetical protein